MKNNLLKIIIGTILFWITFYFLFSYSVATYMVLFVLGFIVLSNAIILLNSKASELYNIIMLFIIGIYCLVLLWIKIGAIMPMSMIIISIIIAYAKLYMGNNYDGR